MSISSTLKNEGITIIGKLNTDEVNKIASNISKKIADAFPEHHIDEQDLFNSICNLDMYIADMPNDSAMAKYFYKNNSIYFSKDMDLDDLNTLAIHECLHFIQEVKNKNGKLLRLGLYDMQGLKNSGMALNEAAVQHMASIATNSSKDTVKYYNMDLSTESPDFYPIQTALLNEMMYFTGTYALYHSTLYSDDIFKNTFIAKTSKKIYEQIETNFDLICQYESLLSNETYNLSVSSENYKSVNKIRNINERIENLKRIIFEKTLETQNIILVNCFSNELSYVRSLEDVDEFKEKLHNFKNVLIDTNNYNFFNDFSKHILGLLEEKREYILKYGNILSLDHVSKELANVNKHTYGYQFFKKLFSKLELLIEEAVRQKEF